MAIRDNKSSSSSGKKSQKDSETPAGLPYVTETDEPFVKNDWTSHQIAYSPSSRPYVQPNTRQFKTQRITTSSVTDGAYGEVSRCVAISVDDKGRATKPFYVAVKKLRAVPVVVTHGEEPPIDTHVSRNRMSGRLKREVDIMRNLSHSNVVPILAYHEGNAAWDQMFVTPWYTGGDLLHWVKRNQTYVHKLDVIEGLASALAYLHKLRRPLIHGDIKPDNIVIDGVSKPIIVDFGLCSMLKEGVNLDSLDSRPASNQGGNHRWMSDLRLEQKHVSSVDDAYAFGCVTLYVLTSKQPFHMARGEMDFWRIRGQHGRPSGKEYFTSEELAESKFPSSDFWWSVLDKCWSLPPTSPGPGSPVNSILSSEDGSIISSPSSSTMPDPAWTPMAEITELIAAQGRNTRKGLALSVNITNSSHPVSITLENNGKGVKHPPQKAGVPEITFSEVQDLKEKTFIRSSSPTSQRSDISLTGSIREKFQGLKTKTSKLFRRSTPSLKTPSTL